MKSKLRERIRKINLDLDKQYIFINKGKRTNPYKQITLRDREFGKDITSCLNKQQSSIQAKVRLSEIKTRAIERKRVERITKKRQSSSQSTIQNIQQPSVPQRVENKQKSDIFSKIVVDCQHVNQYLPQICQYLYFRDQQVSLFENLLTQQYEINQSMRITLVDWIMRIHLKFKLKPETLFKTIAIIDNYTKSGIIKKRQYQLLGITSVYIACKYQQIYPPANSSYTGVCAKLYTFDNILQMQGSILKISQFNVGYSTSKTHLQRLILILNTPNQQSNIARYLVQLNLFNISSYCFSPMTMALSIIALSYKIIGNREYDLTELQFDQQNLLKCIKSFQQFITSSCVVNQQEYAIYDKYKDEIVMVSKYYKK